MSTETVKEQVKTVEVTRDFYKVLLVGQTGKGKTFSFRNLNENTTGFINTENKPLPFRKNFKYHARPKKFIGLMKAIEDYAANPEINLIVIDSISAAFDILLEEMRTLYSGFDIWNNYNKKIGEMMKLIKNTNKEIFITAHYEILNLEGDPERRVKVKGKEWEGVIEKEFTIVLYAEDKWKNDEPEYFYRLAGEGMSAKCPPDMFEKNPVRVPNDAKLVFDAIVKYTS